MVTIKERLSKVCDELLDISKELPADAEDEARMLRTASYTVEDVATSKAVSEMVQTAFTHFGGVGDAEPIGLRMGRRAA